MTDNSDESLYQLTEQLAEQLLKHQHQIATAESCTGGWIAKCCTDLPGSSAWFRGGVVSYSNEIKQDWLNVKVETLQHSGAVSQPVVEQMVQTVQQKMQVDLAVSVSGIAGPGGGSIDKPVGMVWISWADPSSTESRCFKFQGDRESIRRQTVFVALEGLLKKAREISRSV